MGDISRMRLTAGVGIGMLLLASCLQAAVVEEMVPMRDGTRLLTLILLPQGPPPAGGWPAVLQRTPYNARGYLAQEFADRGFVSIAQDLRGYHGSEGEKGIYQSDGWGKNQDGVDTLDWIARQPWSNGKICTYGGSAGAATQYQLAGASSPHHTAMFPIFGPSDHYSTMFYPGGVLRLHNAFLWFYTHHPEGYSELLEHYRKDDFWVRQDVTTRHEQTRVPGLHVAGWYDILLQGNLENFIGMQNRRSHGGRQRLLIGPWTHGGAGRTRHGEIDFPDNSRVNLPRLALQWFRTWCAASEDPGRIPSHNLPVRYYVMGATGEPGAPGNVWRDAKTWPVPGHRTRLYLHPDGALSLAEPRTPGSRHRFEYDPLNPLPSLGGRGMSPYPHPFRSEVAITPEVYFDAEFSKAGDRIRLLNSRLGRTFLFPTAGPGPYDQREVEKRKDLLLFTSDSLPEPMEITGEVLAKLWVSSNRKDTDFTATLTDVYPDGRSMLVCEGILRARFREGLDREVFMEEGRVYPITIDLWSVSYVFNRGHRLRLAISSSSFPRHEPNPNTGEPHWKFGQPSLPATNSVFLEPDRPSHLELNVVHGGG